MKIETRLRRAFAIILLLVVGVGASGALLMRRMSRTLAAALQESFQATAATERLAALAHEHNLVVSFHAAAGTRPDEARLEQIEQDTGKALRQLAEIDPQGAAKSRELIAAAQKRAKDLLGASTEESDPFGSEPTRGEPAPASATAKAASGADQRIARLYAEAEDFLALQHTTRRARMEGEIAKAGRDANLFALVVAALVVAGLGVAALVFAAVRQRVIRPMAELAAVARRVTADRDLTLEVKVTGDDELEELGGALAELMRTLRQLTLDLGGATDRLLAAAQQLSGATQSQSQSVTRQASALEEARRTSTLLHESARAAAEQAGNVLRVAERADALGQEGAAAVGASLSGVEAARQQTAEVAQGLTELAGSAQQIADITNLVKDLASQSNVLAINAALEASRAGMAGAGFALVAQEIRALADRSLAATNQVRGVLGTVLKRLRGSGALVVEAQAELQAGSGSTRRAGETVAGLTGIVRENLGAAREISGAVTRQGAGISQMTTAMDDLTQLMEETVRTVGVTEQAASAVGEVAAQVSTAARSFRV